MSTVKRDFKGRRAPPNTEPGNARSNTFTLRALGGPCLLAIFGSSWPKRDHLLQHQPPLSGTLKYALENSRAACTPGIDVSTTTPTGGSCPMHSSAAPSSRDTADRYLTARHLQVKLPSQRRAKRWRWWPYELLRVLAGFKLLHTIKDCSFLPAADPLDGLDPHPPPRLQPRICLILAPRYCGRRRNLTGVDPFN